MAPASGMPGSRRSRLASSQWLCTHECQSKLPKKIGCRSRWLRTSSGPPMTWSILTGNSRVTWPSAMRAKLEAISGVRRLTEGEGIHQDHVGEEQGDGGGDL